MPLSEPAPREPIHKREVNCRGYLREDGLWDIEGHMRDTKDYAFESRERGQIKAGDAIHDMWLRLTLDNSMTVIAVEAATDHAPFSLCGDIIPNYQQLVGLRIGPGWTKKTKELLGGVRGCTHLLELLGPIATTAFQTIYPYLTRKAGEQAQNSGTENGKPPLLLNTCHAFASNGPIAKREWPAFYTGGREDA
jgi:hypothetical protein